jgi:DNA repair protein RecO (recombination protein O)
MRSRVDNDAGFVLHSYAYRETSLIVETFCLSHGRVAMVARGARRPRSHVRGVLLAFQPLALSWSGKSEIKTLHSAERRGAMAQLQGKGLLCGFYLNELLLKLLAREDPHDALFQHYDDAIRALTKVDEAMLPIVLRRFEKAFLKELGYALNLENDASGAPIEANCRYVYRTDRGAVPLEQSSSAETAISGKTLLDLASDNFQDTTTLQQSRVLMRQIIGHYLGHQSLHTRQLMQELQKT